MAVYDDCIVFLLAKAFQKAHGNMKERLRTYDLTPPQHLVLEALWEEEGLSAGDIGRKLILDSATVSGILDRMVEGGWITKRTDEEDNRFIRVYVSSKAKELKSSLIDERKEANEDILSSLTLEESVLLKRLLREIRG